MDTQEPSTGRVIDIGQIMAMIPHRYPFLMIDRVIDAVPGQSATGIKNVTINDNFFQGHFPSHPVMPGVLIIEAMAQTATMIVQTLEEKFEDKVVYFMSVENARFRKPVTPGDTLQIYVEKQYNRNTAWKFKGKAYVGDVLTAEAVFTAMIMDK